MPEYIEREALMAALCKEIIGDGDYYNGKDDMQDEIRDMVSQFPSADVAPVRHGRWEEASDGGGIVCPFCRTDFCTLIYDTEYFNYCPNCGAKMDLEEANAKNDKASHRD